MPHPTDPAYLDEAALILPVARHVLEAFIASGRNDAIISMVTMMELLVRPLRSTPPSHGTVLAFVRRHPNLEAAPVDLPAAFEAAALRAIHRLRPPDALIVGTALAHEARLVVTNDQAWAGKLANLEDRLTVVTLSELANA